MNERGLVNIEVTVRAGTSGSDWRLTLEAPADVPLGELLPDLRAVARG
jgi:hypothetical protein